MRSGEYMVGICFGRSENTPDLEARYIVDETIVLVPSDLRKFEFPAYGELRVLTTAPQSETWRFIERQIQQRRTTVGACISTLKHHGVLSVGHQMARGRIRPRPRAAGGGAGVRACPWRRWCAFPTGAEHPDQPVAEAVDTGAARWCRTFLESLKRHLPGQN